MSPIADGSRSLMVSDGGPALVVGGLPIDPSGGAHSTGEGDISAGGGACHSGRPVSCSNAWYTYPSEIASAAVYLGSDAAAFITGQILAIDGARIA